MKLPIGCERRNRALFCKIDDKEIRMKYCEWHLGHGSSCEAHDGEIYPFPDAIFPIILEDDRKIETKGYGIIKTGRHISAYNKDLYLVGKMGDLGETGDTSVIVSMYNPTTVVRKIQIEEETVAIDACDGNKPLIFPKDLDIYYEPWFIDNGSFIFINPPGNNFPKGFQLKLATEGDIMKER